MDRGQDRGPHLHRHVGECGAECADAAATGTSPPAQPIALPGDQQQPDQLGARFQRPHRLLRPDRPQP